MFAATLADQKRWGAIKNLTMGERIKKLGGSHTVEYYREVKNKWAWATCINHTPFLMPNEKKMQVVKDYVQMMPGIL